MKYTLQDLIDIEHFQELQDRLNEIYSFPSSIIDNDGNILTATAWQEICTQFHRKNKEAEKICIKSDQYIKDHIHEANPALSYRCPHGLVDNASPIIIDGVHYGNFFTGQFFLEEPKLEFFRAQAQTYGFDEKAYLRAVKKVPIWNQKQLDSYLLFINELIKVISESGLKKLKEEENRKNIQKSEKRYRSILKAAMDGYWVTDAQGRLLEVNEAYCIMSGYSEAELLTMRIADLEVVETKEVVAERMQKVIQAGSDRFESIHHRKDGTAFYVEVSVQYRTEEGGQCICFLRDITERKNAEKKLRKSEETYRNLINNLNAGVVVHAPDTSILISNPSACRILGLSEKQRLGKEAIDPQWRFLREDGSDMPLDEHPVNRILSAKRELHNQVVGIKRPDIGDTTWLLVNGFPVFNDAETIVQTVVNFVEISEIRQAQHSLMEANKKMHLAAESAGFGIWDLDIKNNRLEWDDWMFRLYGINKDHFGGAYEAWQAGVHPDDLERSSKEVEQALMGEKEFDSEFRIVRPNGKVRYMKAYAIVSRDSKGAPIKMTGINYDITDRKKADEAQKESKAFLDNLSDVAYATDDQGNVLWVNQAIERVTGLSPEDIIGRPFLPLFVETDHASLIDVYGRTLAGESLENTLTFKSGVTCHFTSLPKHNQQGDIIGTFGVARDISERLAAENALQTSEARLKKAQAMARVGNWEYDLATGKVWGSEEAFRIYDIERTSGFLPLDELESYIIDEKRVNQALVDLITRKKTYDIEFQVKHKDRKGLTHIHSMADLVYDRDGNPVKVVGVIQDITEIKLTELALKESEERFKALHNASFGGIAIHDKGLILECNKGLTEITGYAYDELIGMNGLYLISDETRDKVVQNIEAHYEKPYEVMGVRKSGELYPLRLEARNIPYRGNNVRVVEFRDISESKDAEREKEELEGKLRQAQKMEAVGRLAGGVAHDFNNMLSVIIGHSGLALEDIDPTLPLYERLKEIKNAGERSADLTRQLLAFARKQTVSPKMLDLNKTVAGMIKMLQRLIGEDIDLMWQPGDNVWPVRMDPSQIDQILANLCVNARDAIADVGKVSIETNNTEFEEAYCSGHPGFLPGEFVLLAVSDNGCGMDAETLDDIFEPFFTTKAPGQGTGLGLATVYGVVKQNNGFVNVYSEPSQGTTFNLYFPRHKTKVGTSSEKAKRSPIERGHETILLVEDETSILRMTAQMLERMGYQVVSARTPGEAIRLTQEYAGKIHLLVTDVVMPEMNGRDLAKKILSTHPDLKRLFMSGYTADVIAHHGVLDEGVNFIQKPFSREQLGAKVREVLDKDEQ